ncbi:MAG: ankyrin repeat domain-containing protein [Spirochaetaceae bacterium]|nr:ankyrin repeat domain-containing protein [Spirochaetaceae bacterium]MBR6566574.1 ankyrin repeat domain-containing protein [Spirochaetaceae bacterium]
MRKIILLLSLSLFSLALLVSCASTEPVESQSPVEPPPANPRTIQELILAGRYDEVKESLQIQRDIDAVDESGNTVLHAAARVNSEELVRLFISLGASTELKNNDSDTALHVAIKNDAIEAAQILSAVDSDIFAMDAYGKTALELGLARGDRFFDAIITTRTGQLQDTMGRTIIHYFVKERNLVALEYAIKKKIPLSVPDNNGETPLALALKNHHDSQSIRMAASLLLNGVKPEGGNYTYFENATVLRNPTLRLEDGQTPLHLSSIQNHTGITSYLLEQGANISAQDISGATPLHESIRYGNLENARLLLDAGAKVNAQDNLGKSPILLIMPKTNQAEIYSLLLSYRANVNIKDMYGDSVLHIATMNGANDNTLNQLILAGADINERNKEGITPLALAVDYRRTAIIQFYINAGADIHAEDNMGQTPLTRSLKAGPDMTKKILISRNIFSRDSYGNTAYHLAILTAEPNLVLEEETKSEKPVADDLTLTLEYIYSLNKEINSQNRDGDTPLSLAVQRNIKRAGEFLLNHGADIFAANNSDYSPLRFVLESSNTSTQWLLNSSVIQATDGSGNTPLHYAAEWELVSAINLLTTERGADANARNANGESPLYNGIKADNPAVIEALVNNGTHFNTRDYLGNTPIHACIRWDSVSALKKLFVLGADLDAKNIAGKSPLAEAARAGKIEFARLLMDHGANINASDETGKTVLMDAIQSGKIELVALLLNNGASPILQEMNGRNAFHEAAVLGEPQILNLVRKAGGDPLSRDKDGNTPLSLVFNKGEEAISAVLGSNQNLSDSYGNSPIHVAVNSQVEPAILDMLLARNYPVNRRNSSGSTPITLAVSQGNLPLASLLLQYGADPFISDNTGDCAVSLALKEGQEILDQLVKQAATKTDISGEGILHYAARISNPETIKRLISMGLSKNQKSLSGERPYDIAIRWKRPEIAALLH